MHFWKATTYRFQDLTVILQGHFRRKAALQTDLCGPLFLGIGHARQDLLSCECVTSLLVKRTELAASYATVGEVDISVYDKRNFVSADLSSHGVGNAK
jgi:hypothetical protein